MTPRPRKSLAESGRERDEAIAALGQALLESWPGRQFERFVAWLARKLDRHV